MRRKMTDMTKKYEDLNMKYQSLQEVGRNEADANFEKLKRAADQKTKDANELIASLKKELAEARKSSNSSSSDTSGMQKQISSLTTSNEKLKTENADIRSSLQAAQNETKSLEAKLVAARQQLSHSASTQEKPSNSATTRNDLSRSVGPNATDAQKEAKMKENLYSDLTGLIIRGVKRKDAEDEYDCIQTGRNGSKSHPSSPTSANPTNLTSPPLPPNSRQRLQCHQPQDSVWPQLRGVRVRVRAAAGREPGPRSYGAPARLPYRGDLLPKESCCQVLYEGGG